MNDPFLEKATEWADKMPEYPWLNQVNKPAVIRILSDFGRMMWEKGYMIGLKENQEDDGSPS